MNKIFAILAFLAIPVLPAAAQTSVKTADKAAAPKTFSEAVRQVISRPDFRHAMFALEVTSLDTGKTVFAYQGDKLMTPGSTTKLFTEGTALKLLGPDYRFHTMVYRTGTVDGKGVLQGDLILVASGDPNISDRLQPDGTLAFVDEDHSYGGPESRLVPGDPLIVLKEFAKQVAAAGIHRVRGKVLIDVSLFPEGHRELGTGEMISPMALNDNAIDITYTPGAAEGTPAQLIIAPQVPYIHFVNKITTVAGSKAAFGGQETIDNPDGSQTVTLSGTIGLQSGPVIYGYPLASPSRFAATLFAAALQDAGVTIDGKPGAITDSGATRKFYSTEYQVAEHVSAPLSEDIKLTLKMSQNLHASMTPYVLGAVVGKATDKIDAKGFMLEHDLFAKAGLDMSGASQSDGAGGATAAFYTPDFVVHYLAYMAAQPEFPVFQKALPVLGRDGTLVDFQRESPAAGHVFAKTGTFSGRDLLNGRSLLVGKGLAGYTTTPGGQHLAFGFYLNHVELQDDRIVTDVTGDALAEIAAALYMLPIDQPTIAGP